MKASINHLGDYNAQVTALSSDPVKRRRRLAMLAGGAALGGVAAVLTAPAAATALGAAALGKVGLVAGASKFTGAVLASKGVTAALGGYKGLRLTQGYFGDLQHFSFLPVELMGEVGSDDHEFVFINGFLSQDESEFADWHQAIMDLQLSAQTGVFADLNHSPGWHLRWDAKHLCELQWSFTGSGVQTMLQKPWRRAPVHMLSNIADNAWHHAYVNARKAGALLADAIWQSPTHKRYTLVGHSLGARVAFYAMQHLAQLEAIAQSNRRPIQHAVFLGAAQGRRNRDTWQQASSVCQGHIFNCYSSTDSVLRWLYQSASVGMSKPAGRGPAPAPVVNIDCTDVVDGHTQWKESMSAFADRLQP